MSGNIGKLLRILSPMKLRAVDVVSLLHHRQFVEEVKTRLPAVC
jgi:ACT domain-containing protein